MRARARARRHVHARSTPCKGSIISPPAIRGTFSMRFSSPRLSSPPLAGPLLLLPSPTRRNCVACAASAYFECPVREYQKLLIHSMPLRVCVACTRAQVVIVCAREPALLNPGACPKTRGSPFTRVKRVILTKLARSFGPRYAGSRGREVNSRNNSRDGNFAGCDRVPSKADPCYFDTNFTWADYIALLSNFRKR